MTTASVQGHIALQAQFCHFHVMSAEPENSCVCCVLHRAAAITGSHGHGPYACMTKGGHTQPSWCCAGAMLKGADGVGSMVGQIFGRAVHYTSGLYGKMGRSSGNLGADPDPPEGCSGERPTS